MRVEESAGRGPLASMGRLVVVLSMALFGGAACGGDDGPGPGVEDTSVAPDDVMLDAAMPDGAADATPETTSDTDTIVNPGDLSCLVMTPLRLWTTDPSAVAMLYRLETCAGETVVLDPQSGESVFDYYTLTENSQSLNADAVPAVDRSERQRAYVTLLLDFSASAQTAKAELLTAAQAFAARVLETSDRVWVGVEIFDGRDDRVTILRPTPSLSELQAAISGLADYSDANSDVGSKNLNGAVVKSIAGLRSWQDQVTARNDAGVVTAGYLVVFTDGSDTAGEVALTEAEAAVATARAAAAVDGGATVQTYAVALKGLDYTADARSDLLAIVGGDARWLYEGALSELDARFTELAARIGTQVEATHLLKFCSPARAGAQRVELDINPLVGAAQTAISFEFSADGFTDGCVEFITTVCEERECGGFNCGGCDDRTEQCEPSTGRCLSECLLQNKCTSESITTALGYDNVCAPESLGVDVANCGGTCVDRESDDAHCGECGTVCDANQSESCEAGACSCSEGLTRCEDECRAAAWFDSNNTHCGACDLGCENGGTCGGGACECPGGWTGPSCETSQCSVACQNGGVCTGPNTCSCESGWSGSACETFVCESTCANGGACVGPNTCSCVGGWQGALCDVLAGMEPIPAGTFMMGSPVGELGRSSNEPQHAVTLTRAFQMHATEVTQGQWKALSGDVNPSEFSDCGDDCPVEMVDWFSALGYANALSASQGLQACYTLTGCADALNGWKDGQHSGCTGATFVGLDCTGYRLPTESEWEYAARAGTMTATYAGDLVGTVDDCTTAQANIDGLAWWCRNSGDDGGRFGTRTHPVAGKTANARGLYDVLGNVWEWTWDWDGTYPGTVTDPLGAASGSYRIIRGGSWNDSAQGTRAAVRGSSPPSAVSNGLGFRLCRTASP